jgi:hypothetical protein
MPSPARLELNAILDALDDGGDEIAVLLVRARRLRDGRQVYGRLDVCDGRSWRKERAEELVDAEVYGDCEIVRLGKGDQS